MALLRKKYFSVSRNSFIDLPTSRTSIFNSTDIGSGSSPESLRLIPFEDLLSTSTLGTLVADLIYNDIQVSAEANKVSNLLSNGVFRQLKNNNFEIKPLKLENFNDEDYVTSFSIHDGTVKIFEETYQLQARKESRTGTGTSGSTTITISINEDIALIAPGMTIISSLVPDGTTVVSAGVVGSNRIVTTSKPLVSTFSTPQPIEFIQYPVFTIGNEIQDITPPQSLVATYPIYRRDTIELDISDLTFRVERGIENTVRPPVGTQLDSLYQITSIEWQNNSTHRVFLKPNNRSITTDIPVGKTIRISKSDFDVFNGDHVVVARGEIVATPYIDISIPTLRDASKNQTTKSGELFFDRYAMFSVLLYKPAPDAPTVILDEIESIHGFSGFASDVIHITKAQLEKDYEGVYSAKRRDYIHLTSSTGNFLDWEEGQSAEINPIIAYKYNEEDIVDYSETQLNLTNFSDLNSSSLTNIPFVIDTIEDNVFNKTEIDLGAVNLAIKNSPNSIGAEGIEIKIVSAPPVFSVPKITKNLAPSTTIIEDEDIDFRLPFDGVSVVVGDFVLITGGPGAGQIGAITSVNDKFIGLSGILKPIDNTSQYIIFKNNPTDIANSNAFILPEAIRSQIVSGTNGTFGPQNGYSKLSFTYPFTNPITSAVTPSPKLNLGTYYFIQVKQRNSGIPENQGSPFITIERTTGTASNKINAFVEVLYKTFTGTYPNSGVIIQDEFGDIGVANRDRTIAPHFRPEKYFIISRSLDYPFEVTPPSRESVFLDPHTGRVKFYPGAEPRKVFLSYYKYDSLEGQSTDFSIKHSPKDSSESINVQDKFVEIEDRFNNGTEFIQPIKVNGISNKTSDGLKGPFRVNPVDNFEITYELPGAENFKANSEDFVAKFSGHYFDDIVRVEKSSILVNSDSEFSFNDMVNEAVLDTSASDDFTDYHGDSVTKALQTGTGNREVKTSVSKLITGPSFNSEDEWVLQTKGTLGTAIPFIKKTFYGAPDYQFRIPIDGGLLDPSVEESVTGPLNDFYSDTFSANSVSRFLLRKAYTENLSYPANKEIKNRFKEREVLKLTDSQLESIGDRSSSKIVSERYLSDSAVLDSKRYKDTWLYLTGENKKLKYYDFIKTKDSQLYFNQVANYHRHKIIGNKIVSLFKDPRTTDGVETVPGSNNLRLQIRNIIKSGGVETDDFTSFSAPVFDEWVTLDPNGFTCAKITKFDENRFGLVVQKNNTAATQQEIYVEVRNLSDGSLVAGSKKVVAPLVFNGDFMDATLIDQYKIAVVYKQSTTKFAVRIYYFDPNSGLPATSTEEITVDNEDILEQPRISRFSKSSFIVAYSTAVDGLAIRMFDVFGKAQFFDENSATSFLQVTQTLDLSGGFFFDIAEQADNAIAIIYSDKFGATPGNVNLYITFLDEYSKTLSDRLLVESDIVQGNRPKNFSIFSINEDNIIVTYTERTSPAETGRNVAVSFSFNGVKSRSVYKDTATTSSYLISQPISGNSFVSFYVEGSSVNFDHIEWRPDFNKTISIEDGSVAEIGAAITTFRNVKIDDSKEIRIVSTATSTRFSVVNTLKQQSETISSFGDNLVHTGAITNLDAIYVNYVSPTNRTVSALLVSFCDATKVYVKIFNINLTTSTVTEITDATEKIEKDLVASSVKLHQLYENRILCAVEAVASKTITFFGINLFRIGFDGTFLNTINDHSFGGSGALAISNALGPFEIEDKNSTPTGSTISIYFQKESGTDPSFTYDTRVRTYDIIGVWPESSGSLNLTTSSVITHPPALDEFVIANGRANFISVQNEVDRSKVLVLSTTGQLSVWDLSFFDVYDPSFLSGYSNVTGASIDTGVSSNPVVFKSNIRNCYCYAYRKGTDLIYKLFNFNKFPDAVNELSKIGQELTGVIQSELSGTTALDGYLLSDHGARLAYNSSADEITSTILYIAPHSYDINKERVVELEDGKKMSFLKASLKLSGIDFRGVPLEKIALKVLDAKDLSESQINDSMLVSEIKNLSANIVSFTDERFAVVLHYEKEKQNKVLIRSYNISRNRVFAESDWIEAPELSWSVPNRNIGLRCLDNGVNKVFTIFVSPSDGFVKYGLIDGIGAFTGSLNNLPLENSQVNSSLQILCFERLVEGWYGGIIYDSVTKLYWTPVFDERGVLLDAPTSFSISEFDRELDLVSEPTVTPWGYFGVYYFKNNEFRFHQHGWNGKPWGSIQLIGKNYLENIKTSTKNEIFANVKKSLDREAKLRRVEINLNNGSYFVLNDRDVFGDLDSAVYRIWIADDPLISADVYYRVDPQNVRVISADPSVANSDIPDELCFFLDGSNLVVKNNLGSNKKIIILRNT